MIDQTNSTFDEEVEKIMNHKKNKLKSRFTKRLTALEYIKDLQC